ncbi:MAG: 30S ribosomal protein S3 [Planctomycetes bacterium]|nr:30S ribosomal protein S3 [Planctomycetota bacterium]
MGQKCNPIGFRTGITEGWKSRWYAPKSAFGAFLVEDERIRTFIDTHLNRGVPFKDDPAKVAPPAAGVSKVEIERTRDEVKVILHTARPGLIIGTKGAEVEKLKGRLEDMIERRVNVSIIEIRNPDLDSRLIGTSIGEQLKKRASFRRVMKQKCEAAMAAGARGVKIICSGRLGGAELARTEKQMLGSIPLQTLQAEVDFAVTHCVTTVGVLGIKVWIYHGMYGETPLPADTSQQRFRRRARR